MGKEVKRTRKDLFGIPVLGFLFKNKHALLFYRLLSLFLFLYALIYGFLYPTREENAFTTAIFWSLFWPFFMVITLNTLGSVFCMVCPLGFLGRNIQKVGLKLRPPKWLRSPFIGIVLSNILAYWFILYTFPGLLRKPVVASVFFSVFLLVSILVFFLFRGMAFCKYLCPVGSVSSAFSRVGFTWLSTYKEVCESCRKPDCALSCPYELNPSKFDERNSMANCTLCMECAHACPAVRFEVRSWGSSLVKRIQRPLNWEVWVYILMVAVITVAMRLHHGLGRIPIAEYTPWVVFGKFLQESLGLPAWIDLKGLFAMLTALVIVLLSVYISVWLSSKVGGIPKKEVFLEIGYAFAPLMIVCSLAHVGEFFFIHYYSDIVNGLSQAFGLGIHAQPLARRGEDWLFIFKVFPFIAGVWSLFILKKRVDLIRPKHRKLFLLSSSILPIVYLFLWSFVLTANLLFGGHRAG